MKELFLEYGHIINGVSLGTLGLMALSIMRFFKKDKYVSPFMVGAVSKANKFFGEKNVAAFLLEAKSVSIKDLPKEVKNFADKFIRVESMLEIILKNQLALGVYDNNPELKETVEKLIWKTTY